MAASIEEQLDDVQQNHREMITVMKNMPVYLDRGDLATWEHDYRCAIGIHEDESSETYKAIDLIYEVAALNLFGKFQERESRKTYKRAIKELIKMGLSVPSNLDVSEW